MLHEDNKKAPTFSPGLRIQGYDFYLSDSFFNAISDVVMMNLGYFFSNFLLIGFLQKDERGDASGDE